MARSHPAAVLHDSDDDYPKPEPEFIVHIMDDDDRPSPPPPQPAPAPAAAPPPKRIQQRPPMPYPPPADMLEKKCSPFFVARGLHCAAVMVLAIVIFVMVDQQPEETRDPSSFLLGVCAFMICVFAVTWLMAADCGEGDPAVWRTYGDFDYNDPAVRRAAYRDYYTAHNMIFF